MFINKISHSKEDKFLQCGWKYYLYYVLRIPGDKSPNEETLQFGSYIHRIFERGYQHNTLEGLLEIAGQERSSYKFSDSNHPPDKVEMCLKNFLKFNENLKETIGVELHLEIERDGFTQVGIIDRVIKGENGDILIIDYKTSKQKNEKTKAQLFTDRQLQGYATAVSKHLNMPLSRITAAHYYPLTNNFVFVKYHAWQGTQYLKELTNNLWAIRKKKKTEFYPQQNSFCNWCEYKRMCPEFELTTTAMTRINEQVAEKKRKKDESNS